MTRGIAIALSGLLVAGVVLAGCSSSAPAGAGSASTAPAAGAGSASISRGAGPSVPVSPPPPESAALSPRGPVDPGWRVSRVVDGDTVWATRSGVTLKVRLIGIDTPETVDPNEGVGCFGPESSQYATTALLDRRATLEYDPTQDRQDRYGRTLAYLWLDGETPGTYAGQYNYDAVRGGFARQYLYDREYAWYPEFVAAEESARAEGLGQWGACPPQS